MAGNDYTPVFSPDGRRIAYASFRGLHADIYVMNLDGSTKDTHHDHRLRRRVLSGLLA